MTQLNDYELERQRNIERNRELLAQLELPAAVSALGSVATPTPPTKARPKKKRDNKARVVKPDRPTRASSRLRGLDPPPFEITEDDSISGTTNEASTNTVVDPELWDGRLLTGDEYFNEETRKNAIRVDGHYAGWINPELVEKYHFEASAAEAWEKNGGGTFSFKDPTGSGKKKGSGRFNAKAAAQAMFKKNPNMYFYRHNEPGVEQWTGDWTEEEKKLFLQVAREHGCGDKWGLFASYIPHRVGYQCSNFYRSEILPSGLIFDDNYKYTPSGRPIYVGKHGARG
ncbi:hypothetical protein LRAMOSA09062 [Lichtheimia ramosa]|uniref:DNA damage-binding protein CMR1 n=1 Tax=Lichtheimia ramosa TaxID=688394 RepID=A0A077WHB0_9FUNG|nr:hypothetical protein LRAMOSA09062 [Lichtheimia ramosa]